MKKHPKDLQICAGGSEQRGAQREGPTHFFIYFIPTAQISVFNHVYMNSKQK